MCHKWGEKNINATYNIQYMGCMVILCDPDVKKKNSLGNFNFLAAQSEKLHAQIACQSLEKPPPPAPPPLHPPPK